MNALTPATQHTKQLFVIDQNVNGWRDLVNNTGLGVSVLILDPLQDGLTQIADAITAYSNLDAIHILSHGSIASLQLGSATLNSENINQYTQQLTTIGNALNENGDLLLYGCDVAQGNAGQQFIEQLSVLTGADVAASTNLTGDANQGGDWVLESQTGAIEATSIITKEAQAAYHGTLGTTLGVFAATDAANGRELWITDGTAAGTSLLKDIVVGTVGSSPQHITSLGNGKTVFTATNLTTDYKSYDIWVTDGTAAGTSLVKNSPPQYHSADQFFFTAIGNGKALFGAFSGFSDSSGFDGSLWVTDGTAAGTNIVIATNVYYPESIAVLSNGKALFSAHDSTNGSGLWITDGTTAGTSLVKGSFNTTFSPDPPQYLTSLGNGKALFNASDAVNGSELWITDGTTAGTGLVKDIVAGTDSSRPSFFTALGNGKAVFDAYNLTTGHELWVTDGTAVGTNLVKNGIGSFDSISFTVLGNGKVLFSSTLGLWVTDATTAGTNLVKNIFIGIGDPYSQIITSLGNGKALFSAYDSTNGYELWISDGTTAGTNLVKDINTGINGSKPQSFTALGNGKATFSATDENNGTELWITDGTAAGTSLLKDINTLATQSSNPSAVTLLVGTTNIAPSVQAGTTTAFTEQTPVTVAGTITINDPNGDTDWNGGTLQVQITANNSVDDSLALPTANNGGVWLNAGNVLMANTTAIGSANTAVVSNSSVWTFTFNAAATNALVQDTARTIQFINNSDAPSTAARTVMFTVTDKNAASNSAVQTVSITTVNDTPTLTSFTTAVASGTEDSEIAISFASLQAQGNSADVDGTVTAFVIKAVNTGTLKIGTDALTATVWSASNNTVDASHQAYWTPALNTNGTLNAFTAVAKDNGGLESIIPVQATVSIVAINDAPTLTSFSTAVATGNEDNEIAITFASLQSQGNAADVDGSVTAFVIKTVNTGSLKIGTDALTATVWSASNNTVDTTHQAYWTPALNANGTLNAFTAVAKDNAGLESITSVQATVSIAAHNTLGTPLGVFAATDTTNGSSALWVTDGTTAGTSLLKAITTGTGFELIGSNVGTSQTVVPQNLTSFGNGKALFVVNRSSLPGDYDVWETDGTTAGTGSLVTNISFSLFSIFNPPYFTALGNGKALFNTSSSDLWVTDGTAAGTNKVVVPNGFNVNPSVSLGNGKALFSGRSSLWISDGTAAGTSLVKTITPVIIPGTPVIPVSNSNIGELTSLGNGIALFSAFGKELWITDGTTAGTGLVKDIFVGTSSFNLSIFTVLGNGKAVFCTNNATNVYDLWMTDGTAAGTNLVKAGLGSINNVYRQSFTSLGNGEVLFRTNLGLWVTDGTTVGTNLLSNIVIGTSPYTITPLGNGQALFNAYDSTNGYELWITDGTTAGTHLVKDINAGINNSNPRFITALGNGKATFSATDANNDTELWITDGTAAGTTLLKDINPQTNYSSNPSAVTLITGVNTNTNSAPNVLAGTTTVFTEQKSLAVAGTITINDPNFESDWDGGTLQVQITGNNSVNDSLALPTAYNTGIWLSGNIIYSNNAAIGSANATIVSNGSKWTFTFNVAATNALVQDTARAIQFANNSDAPNTVARTVTFTVTDKYLASSSATQTITVTNINEAPTFFIGGADGIVTTAVGSDNSGLSVTVQADGKILVAGSSRNGGNNDFALIRYNSDGFLDTSFDGDGIVTTAVGSSDDLGYSVTVQADGKILVAGSSRNVSNSTFALTRYNSDGSLDTSFDSDGIVTTAVGSYSGGNSVTVQADGKILVAGSSFNGSNSTFALTRYNSDGSLDTSFDSDGIVTTAVGSYSGGNSVTVQADGKILVAGSGDYVFALTRYNSDGSLDTSFDSDGIVTTTVSSYSSASYSVTMQTDGKILVAGDSYNYNGSNYDFALTRYNSDGSLDTSFDSDGKVITAVSSRDDFGYSVTVQVDGKILVAGESYNGRNSVFTLIRYNSNGSLDTSFDTDGIVTTAVGSSFDKGYSVTVQADGKILLAGYSYNGITNFDTRNPNFAIIRYNSDGSLDPTFDLHNTLGGTVAFTEGGTAVVLDNNVILSDADLNATNYNGATLTLARTGSANAEDVFSSTAFSGANVTVASITIGTYIQANGSLVITFNAAATQTLVNQTLQTLAYSNSSHTTPASVQIDWTFSDGNTGAQGAGAALSTVGSSIVNITSVNDAPTLTSFSTAVATGNEDSEIPISFANLQTQSNASDVDGTVTAFVIKAVNSGSLKIGTDALSATAWSANNNSVDASHQVYWTPALNANGVLNAFTAVAKDNGGLESASAIQVALNVTPSNDAPVLAHALIDQTTNQSTAFSYTIPADSFIDIDAGDTLSYQASLADGSVLPAWLSFNVVTRTFSGTPLATNVGNLNIKLTATDSAGASVSDDFVLVVAADNHNPTGFASAALIAGVEDSPYTIGVADLLAGFSDIDGDSLSITALTTNHGTVFNDNNGTFTITPTANYNGVAVLNYDVLDGHGGSIHGVQSLNLLPVNDAPSGTDKSITVNENNSYTFTSADFGFSDIDGNNLLAVKISSLPLAGSLKLNGVAVISNASISVADINNAQFTFSPAASTSGSNYASFNFQVQDNGGIANGGVNLDIVANTLSFNVAVVAPKNLVGTADNDALMGGAGNDIFSGGAGTDVMAGGAGNDSYYVDNASDAVIEGASEGLDTVYSGVDYTLGDNIENLVLMGSVMSAYGNALNNQLTGNSADNLLVGGAGADTMIGGAGNDVYSVDNIGDIIKENANEGWDVVWSSSDYTLSANVEALYLLGTDNLNAVGNAELNYLFGNSGNNKLDGGAGSDTLDARAGNDILDGGVSDIYNPAVIDTLNGGAGDDNFLSRGFYGAGNYDGGMGNDTLDFSQSDTYTAGRRSVEGAGVSVDLANNKASTYYLSATNFTWVDANGQLAVIHIENVTGTAQGDQLIGDANANVLEGGNGSDILSGGTGKDWYLLQESVAATDTIKIATGDSLIDNYDIANSFGLGTGTANTVSVDKLDLSFTSIAANANNVNGTNFGNVGSHSISNGLISFANAIGDTPLTITAANLTDAINYVQAAITGNNSVAFISEGNIFVFQDGGVTDTLVELVGVMADSVNNSGLGAGAVWIV